MADLGFWAVLVTLLASVYTSIASVVGARRPASAFQQSARNGALITAVSATLAVGSLLLLLLGRDFRVRYVYEHTSTQLPIPYTISALWAGQEGSLLVWLWFAAILGGFFAAASRTWRAPFAPCAVGVIALTEAFLASVLLLTSNPFATLPTVPADGQGLNPLLQNVWMVAHPPVVFMGYAAYVMPFALAVGALATGDFSREWLATVRRWSLWAWLFLGAGIIMGAWWAYLELGWGGYWGWDPVENSSLIPWLTGTALLHSLVRIRQRRGSRAAFGRWNLWLITSTFVLCLFASFVTRSGLIQSVHAFGRSSLGYYFGGYIIFCLVIMGYLLRSRGATQGDWPAAQWGDDDPAEGRSSANAPDPSGPQLPALLSRETGLLLTNLLLVGAAAVVLLGILLPTIIGLLQGRQISLDTSFYERTVGPLALAIVLVIGVCPWLARGGLSSQAQRGLLPSLLVGGLAAVVLFVAGIDQGLAVVSFAVAAFVLTSIAAMLYRDIRARQRSTGENLGQACVRLAARNRPRYGAHLVHLGVVLIAIGITGSSIYQREVQMGLARGERIAVDQYAIEYREARIENSPLRRRVAAEVVVSRDGRELATLLPRKDYYWDAEQWVSEVAIHTTLREDVYVILAGIEGDGLASFRVLLNPLVAWLWVGGGLLLIGGVVAWWPTGRRSSPA